MARLLCPTLALAGAYAITLCTATTVAAQDQAAPPHDHARMLMEADRGWHLMQEGVVFAEFNHQGGPRGGDEVIGPNWWMGMAGRKAGHGQLTLTAMFSLDPATVGKVGYRELFKPGEAADGRPNVDRQHPHDFFMQLAAAWRVPLNATTGLTLAGGPAGEAALGPTAFMHRASAADNPSAPLSHHTFDSTHVAFGVVTAAVDHGRWTVEGSVFNGREPDDRRWNIDWGRLDSVSGRIWFRPTPNWALQLSTGHLVDPEALEPGNIERSTVSASWTRAAASHLDAATVGYGRNDADHGSRQALFIEGARRRGPATVYGRFEAVQVETATLLQDAAPGTIAAGASDSVIAWTLGGVMDFIRGRGVRGGIGADVSVNRTPTRLESVYGSHPVSFRVFLRLTAGERMWNMRMAEPMTTGMHH